MQKLRLPFPGLLESKSLSKVWPSWSLFSLVLALAGCGSDSTAYFPLQKGNGWTYQIRGQVLRVVQPVSIIDTVSIQGSPGWRLRGPMGENRLAWIGSSLVASKLGGVLYDPPITILNPAALNDKIPWKGTMTIAGKSTLADAELAQSPSKYTISSVQYTAIRTTLIVRTPGKVITTDSVYASGLGLVSQEERLNGKFTAMIEYLSGP